MQTPFVKNYIVRVYYTRDEDPENVIGIVEEVGTPHGVSNFHTIDELVSIIRKWNKREHGGKK